MEYSLNVFWGSISSASEELISSASEELISNLTSGDSFIMHLFGWRKIQM